MILLLKQVSIAAIEPNYRLNVVNSLRAGAAGPSTAELIIFETNKLVLFNMVIFPENSNRASNFQTKWAKICVGPYNIIDFISKMLFQVTAMA